MGQRVHPGDSVVVTSGDLIGCAGQVLSIDPRMRLAYVNLRLPHNGGTKGVAVLTLGQLRAAGSTRRLTVKGRPRTIPEATIDRMHHLRDHEQLTHAQIALRLDVSKSSVSHYLRRAQWHRGPGAHD